MAYGDHVISCVGIDSERDEALYDIQGIVRNGEQIIIKPRVEDDVIREAWNSIKKREPVTSLNYWALPIVFDPTDKQLELVGIRERVEVIAYTSMLDWNESGFTLEHIQSLNMVRSSVTIRKATYELKEKSLFDQNHDTYLYVVLGCNRI